MCADEEGADIMLGNKSSFWGISVQCAAQRRAASTSFVTYILVIRCTMHLGDQKRVICWHILST